MSTHASLRRRAAAVLLGLLMLCAAMPCGAAPQADDANPSAMTEALDRGLERFNGWVAGALFFSVTGDLITAPQVDDHMQPVLDTHGKPKRVPVGFPFIVFTLVSGGLLLTFYYGFVNVRGLRHALDVLRGHYDDPNDDGDVTHFQALTAALSATVGLGNIAGVAIAIQVGGPGAMFWMFVAAFLGMSLKLTSCTLSQIYRRQNPDGTISGGPMYYLEAGLSHLAPGSPIARLGKVLAVVYALMIIGGSFGGGNMFQANQSFGALQAAFGLSDAMGHPVGILLATMVAIVILGGIRRIASATSRIVPLMVLTYGAASLYVVLANLSNVPTALENVFTMAFTDNAVYGGMLGVVVKGFQRASFSNEAGVGSAAIAHAAARTDEPVREGLVAMLEPVIDTMIVCSMTAMVVIATGVWNDPVLAQASGDLRGVELTAAAFATALPWFPAVLTGCVLLFAYSTMISWAYYGERGWIYLVDHLGSGWGHRSLVLYRLAFVLFVYVGTVTKAENVLTFSDLMILCMALPNILGGLILAPSVKRHIDDYLNRHRAGTMATASASSGGD